MKKLLTLLFGTLILISCGEKTPEKNASVSESNKTAKVILKKEEGKFQLYVNN